VGIPNDRGSRKYLLEYDGDYFPPKYIISIANSYANGQELNSAEFGGGKESNSFLIAAGFKIIEASSGKEIFLKRHREFKEISLSKSHHDERCPKCKETILKILEKLYGEIKQNYKFEIGTCPEDFIETPYYNNLKEIYETLQNYRNFTEFIKSKIFPNCDFYIPNPGFIVEFDESQHFTSCRKQSLLNYPDILGKGFDINKWVKLCENVDAKDNDPPYRDEQRAWYDTLRDFVPLLKHLKPTVRLYSKDLRWCNLNPEVPNDVEKFKILLERKKNELEIQVKEDPKPFLARIVIAGDWKGEIDSSKEILLKVGNRWPKEKKVNCLVTCGAFLNFEWPQSITNVGNNIYPDENTLNLLSSIAIKQCKKLMDEELRNNLLSCTDYITIGIDSYKDKISMSNVSIKQLHIELIVLLDLKTNKYYLTGKSYPTVGQENGLVRFQDLKTHFISLPFGKTMILGCHDLNMYNPRGKAVSKKEWRKQIRESFYDIVKEENPTIVLHHPHTTDSSRIWTSAWSELVRQVPTVKAYISAGRYYNDTGERSDINDVLKGTKLGNTIDFIVS
jgi:hypothetical protein